MEKLKIGSIVELMNQEGDIYNCLITECDVLFKHENAQKNFIYRGITYPYGFIGVDSSSHFDNNHIIKVIHKGGTTPKNTSEISPGTIITHNGLNFMVTGKNVKLLGLETIDTYACIKCDGGKTYDITYLQEKDFTITQYGYADQEYLDYIKDRNLVRLLMRYNRLLPIGSVVQMDMKGYGVYDFAIINRNVDVKGKRLDYVGVPYDFGYRGHDKLVYFNKENILDISYIGHINQNECDLMLSIMVEKGYLGGLK